MQPRYLPREIEIFLSVRIMQPRYLPREIVIFLARGSNYAATVFTEGNRNFFVGSNYAATVFTEGNRNFFACYLSTLGPGSSLRDQSPCRRPDFLPGDP